LTEIEGYRQTKRNRDKQRQTDRHLKQADKTDKQKAHKRTKKEQGGRLKEGAQ
jgi:hypothetical protein